MAVPKKKTSHAKKGKRRANWNLATPSISRCANCGETCRPHRVCRKCGHYGDREVMVVED